VTSKHRHHTFLELEDAVKEKQEEILKEIKEIESKKLPEIQRKRSTIDVERYEGAIEAVFQQEDNICSAVRDLGSKLRKTITEHKIKNQDRGNKIKFTQHRILNSIQEAKDAVRNKDSNAILNFKGIDWTQDSLQLLDDSTPQLAVNSLQEKEITSLFGQLVLTTCTADKVCMFY
jgi:hypothetical protein